MMIIILFSLLVQEPISPVAVQWSFKTGQEFFVVEYQRQYIQVLEPVQTNSYFDTTRLWRYSVVNRTGDRVMLKVTLEKIIVNNPNESGARAEVMLKNMEGTQSEWVLIADQQTWKCLVNESKPGKHSPPWFLTVGTRDWDKTPVGWKQEWEMPIPSLGQAQIQLSCTLKQQTQSTVNITTSAKPIWKNIQDAKVELVSSSSLPLGMGEYDINRKCWQYFDYRFSGTWRVQQHEKTAKVKLDFFGGYRWYERQPLMR